MTTTTPDTYELERQTVEMIRGSGDRIHAELTKAIVGQKAVIEEDERIGASNDLVPHRVWTRWMNQCITSGREYIVTLKQAKASFPKAKGVQAVPPPFQ